jgi:hypothetical protein
VVTSYTSVRALLTTAVPARAILPAVVQVKIPVGIRTILPPPKEIGLGAVIVTTAVVPEIKVMGLVGAIVVAEAIVGAAAEVAIKPEYFKLVNVGLPVQLLISKVGLPVQLVITPLVGVPNSGVTSVGLVANTKEPVPVSSVTAVLRLAELGVPKKVATPVPKLVIPVPPLATGKVPVTPVVKGKPVQLVNTPDCGDPNKGVVKAQLVNKLVLVNCLVVAPC